MGLRRRSYLSEGESQYKTLNDAASVRRKLSSGTHDVPIRPELAKGPVEIWYMKKGQSRDFMMGAKWLEKKGLLPSVANVSKTHILLGKVKERDLEKIFTAMQGENWSPGGEARGLIRSKGLTHTSMSVGDIVVIGKKGYIVDISGFKPLK